MGNRLRALILVVAVGLVPAAARAESTAEASALFINTLVSYALQTLRDPALPESEREQRLGAVLVQDFDIPRVARYVLGRYWTTASEDERRQFGQLFERWVVRTYTARLSQYGSETVKVTGAQPEADTGAVVTSQIVHPSGPPTRVEWRVSRQSGNYRIIDIGVEGVSMAITQREEIAAAIQRNGGTVAALNRTLEEKLRGATAAAAADPASSR